jgi:alkanesulfonate monooxygenase SsuD/methylene tetrahydromethanopterin reductase-like flavin-dependent oxidoreductase (luciferase family)
MRYGVIITSGDPGAAADLAALAEGAGWDGVFTYDAIAIGPSLRPVGRHGRHRARPAGRDRVAPARRRPWKPPAGRHRRARTAPDAPVGLGALDDAGFGNVGEPTDPQTRARRMDEALAILDGLWTGEPFGSRYTTASGR